MRLIIPHAIGCAIGFGLSMLGFLPSSWGSWVLYAAGFLVIIVSSWIGTVRLIEFSRLKKRVEACTGTNVYLGSFWNTLKFVLYRMLDPAHTILDMQKHGHSPGRRRVFAHVVATVDQIQPYKARLRKAYALWDKSMLFKDRPLTLKDFFVPGWD